jgi:phosphate transport system permease protein
MSAQTVARPRPAPRPARTRRAGATRRTSLFAHGEPLVWLTGGSLGIALAMIAGLLALVVWRGGATFWPGRVLAVETSDGQRFMGEVAALEHYAPRGELLEDLSAEARAEIEAGRARRRMLRTENQELTGTHYRWVSDFEIRREWHPEWALVIERLTRGRFYGMPKAFLIDGVAQPGEAEAWQLFLQYHGGVRERWRRRRELETEDIGRVSQALEEARLDVREAELEEELDAASVERARRRQAEVETWAERESTRIQAEIAALQHANDRYALALETADGVEVEMPLQEIVRAYPANQLGTAGRLGVYGSRWGEFLTDEPRNSNNDGGVLPAIFGTVAMTMIMSFLVVPFGVLAAMYLREYAKPGPMVSSVRIAINNLAGVPSIVFGVFGLGFFCYIVGASLDELLFEARLPNPTFGKGGLLWASLTLALLTLPVVIVPSEEALAAVPGSMREGSYACGATKWQTLRRIVLPRAAPGILTGMILAIARGAGEVAPLMLVGAVKLAPKLPVDSSVPFVHAERSFMHLGFHIYDLGFQSQNSEAAKPMVFTTTLLLIAIVVALNLIAIWVRARLRRRYRGVS